MSNREDIRYQLTDRDILALRSYADEYGRKWKSHLAEDWYNARARLDYSKDPAKRIEGRGNILHNLRNVLGPTWLDKLRLKRLMTSEEMAKVKLAYFDEVPAYRHRDDNGEGPKWSGKVPPPAIGETVKCNVYNRDGFEAVVTGYFTQSGWLGVTADLKAPPAEFLKREDGDTRVHLFGAELL